MNDKLKSMYYVNIAMVLGGGICLVTAYILDLHFFREIFVRSTMKMIKDFHIWSGYAFTLFLIWHCMQNWTWLKNTTQHLFKKKS